MTFSPWPPMNLRPVFFITTEDGEELVARTGARHATPARRGPGRRTGGLELASPALWSATPVLTSSALPARLPTLISLHPWADHLCGALGRRGGPEDACEARP